MEQSKVYFTTFKATEHENLLPEAASPDENSRI